MAIERITSAQNPLIRHVKKLQSSRSYREACGEFVADGFKLLREAVLWYPHLKTVLYTEGSELPELDPAVRVVEVPGGLMESLSSMRSPQGVVFTMALPEQVEARLRPGTLLLDRIQDPGNLGTILRTADAFDIPVVLTNGCADPYSEKTLRASMGAVLRTAPRRMELETVLAVCREQRLPLIATALTDKAKDVRNDPLDGIVVIGSEGQGICRELLEASDRQIIIPMQPRCESLNAAVAAAIVLWQMAN